MHHGAPTRSSVLVAVLGSMFVALGCDATAPVTPEDDGGVVTADWRECDPIVPSACGLPFPSDVYTVPDVGSPTGLRVRYRGRAVPHRTRTLEPFESLDGFSPASSPMTHLPG